MSRTLSDDLRVGFVSTGNAGEFRGRTNVELRKMHEPKAIEGRGSLHLLWAGLRHKHQRLLQLYDRRPKVSLPLVIWERRLSWDCSLYERGL